MLDDLVALIDAGEAAEEQRAQERANIQRIITQRLPASRARLSSGGIQTTSAPAPRKNQAPGKENSENRPARMAPIKAKATPAPSIAISRKSPASSEYLDACKRALMHPDTMRAMGWRKAVMLRLVCKATAEGGEDGWSTLCDVIAADVGLVLPPVALNASNPSFKKIFFEHLYPARNRWATDTEASSDFKIRVAVRFKPGKKPSRGELVLPLHQRLKMMKKGEKISVEEARGEKGLPVEIIEQLAKSGVDVTPEILEMLMEARQLACTVQNAETEARGEDRVHLKGEDSAWESAGGGSQAKDLTEEEKQRIVEEGAASTTNVSAEHGRRTSGENKPEGGAANDEVDGAQSRRRAGDKPRVLTTTPCKVVLYVPGLGIRPFHFINTFEGARPQRDIYYQYAQDAVTSALNGFNSCFMAYGQTGSGKSHSLFGPVGSLDPAVPEAGPLQDDHGVVVRAACDIIDRAVDSQKCGVEGGAASTQISVAMQYIQVYNEAITDLLGGGKVDLRTSAGGKIILQGAAEVAVTSRGGLVELLRSGESRKKFAATAMNDHSSRAHTIVVMHLSHRRGDFVAKSELHLVDLAGCEQIKKSKVTGQAKREAVGINSSLCVLKKVIRALNEDKSHIPYMESKLTQLLRPAFGGSSRTYALITGSTDDYQMEETYQAIRFGEECSMISNAARQAATSLEAATKAIDAALDTCGSGMRGLEERGKTHLPAFKKLQERYAALSRKRADLQAGGVPADAEP